MSVKKTSSPLSSGAESFEPLDAKDGLRRGEKIDKNFEAALAEVAGEVVQAGANDQAGSPARSAFQQIAASANLDTPEGALSAVRESAEFLVESRLKDKLKDSKHGEQLTAELSDYIAKDPFLNRKILGVLQRLK